VGIVRKMSILGVPSSAGARRTGQESAPQSLRDAGLVRKIQSCHVQVTDEGDLPRFSYAQDLANPRNQNVAAVRNVANLVADRIQMISRRPDMPLVIGGDCTITLGVISGLLRQGNDAGVGLVYFDADLDLNTPMTTPSGILDGMGLAHLIGRGLDDLRLLGPRLPMVLEEQVLLFGYNPEGGGIDPPELEVLRDSSMIRYPLGRIRGQCGAMARRAMDEIDDLASKIVVHFDVDVLDHAVFPATDVPHAGGLGLAEAEEAITAFLSDPRVAALVVTEFNASLDVSGEHANVLSGLLAHAVTEWRRNIIG
jgi:arginase